MTCSPPRSPAAPNRSMAARTDAGIEPRWTGMFSACTRSSPSGGRPQGHDLDRRAGSGEAVAPAVLLLEAADRGDGQLVALAGVPAVDSELHLHRLAMGERHGGVARPGRQPHAGRRVSGGAD